MSIVNTKKLKAAKHHRERVAYHVVKGFEESFNDKIDPQLAQQIFVEYYRMKKQKGR